MLIFNFNEAERDVGGSKKNTKIYEFFTFNEVNYTSSD